MAPIPTAPQLRTGEKKKSLRPEPDQIQQIYPPPPLSRSPSLPFFVSFSPCAAARTRTSRRRRCDVHGCAWEFLVLNPAPPTQGGCRDISFFFSLHRQEQVDSSAVRGGVGLRRVSGMMLSTLAEKNGLVGGEGYSGRSGYEPEIRLEGKAEVTGGCGGRGAYACERERGLWRG